MQACTSFFRAARSNPPRCPRPLGLCSVAAVAALLLVATPVLAAAPKGTPSVPPAPPAQTSEPQLNHAPESPRGAVYDYLVACRRGDYTRAAHYLDLRRIPEGERATRGPTLAHHLRVVLDRTLWIDLDSLSDSPAGFQNDGLPPDRDRVGTIRTTKGPVDVYVERVTEANGTKLWKFSEGTVARIPALWAEFGYGPLGEILPAPFFELRLLEIQLWQWIGLIASVLLAWLLSWLVARGFVRITKPLAQRTTTTLDDRLFEALVSPLRLLAGAWLFAGGTLFLDLALLAQQFFTAVEQALTILAVTWLSFRLIDVGSAWTHERLVARDRAAATAIVPLGRRVVKAALAALAVLFVLQNFGVNVTGLIAGLGVGGIAVALAAKTSIENFFGGVTVIADQPVRVGDFCRFGSQVGTVEDIGLRSTRVRTLDRTVVTVANSEFAQMQLENFSKRDRIWYHPTIGLRYETTPDQIRYVLVEIRKMLYAHPKVDPDPARIRFTGFGAYSLNLDVFAYVGVTDYGEYLEICEDLNLRIMDIVERAGSGFAFPSQTMYLGRDTGLDESQVQAAEEAVRTWREKRALFLPGFPPEEIAKLKGTLDYPPAGSPSSPKDD